MQLRNYELTYVSNNRRTIVSGTAPEGVTNFQILCPSGIVYAQGCFYSFREGLQTVASLHANRKRLLGHSIGQ